MSITGPQQENKQHPLQKILQKQTKVITNDGRVFVGILRGLDQALNCILNNAEQRIYSLEHPVRRQQLGVFFIRGDSIIAIGQFIQDQQQLNEIEQLKCKSLEKCQ